MNRHLIICVSVLAVGISVATAGSWAEPHTYAKPVPELPVRFEVNKGQAPGHIDYIARGCGYTISLSPTESVALLTTRRTTPKTELGKHAAIRMKIVGADTNAAAMAYDKLHGTANYFVGKDPAKWHTNIATYEKVRYNDIRPGIDIVYYGNKNRLEYDFIVAPGADPADIKLSFDGSFEKRLSTPITIDKNGDLLLNTNAGDLRLRRPETYQKVNGTRQYIDASYSIENSYDVTFQIGEYDTTRPLVIDPVLVYSTYLGGSSNDYGRDIDIDSSGNAYITGSTASLDFPLSTTPVQPSLMGREDVFISKLDPSGAKLIYSTYIGGTNDDIAHCIAVDEAGNAYIAGESWSTDFPTTISAIAAPSAAGGGFVAKLQPDGARLIYSTYIGVSCYDIDVDPFGNVYFAGNTGTWDFQETTPGAPWPQPLSSIDAFIGKINPDGSRLEYGTYLGGSMDDVANSVAVDSSGNAVIAGTTESSDFPATDGAFQTWFASEIGSGMGDAFVAKIDPTGSRFVYVTFLGGIDDDSGIGVATTSAGEAFITGSTFSFDFPTKSAAQSENAGYHDLFAARFNAAGDALVYCTYIGGSKDDYGMRCAVDGDGYLYVTGATDSTDFPVTEDATQPASKGYRDAIVTRIDPSGMDLAYSSYLGGSMDDEGLAVAVGSNANAYITGFTASPEFPVTSSPLQPAHAGGSFDAYVTRINTVGGATDLTIDAIVPAEGPVTGGGDVVITGNGFDRTATVLFGDISSPAMQFISDTELRATVPAGSAGTVDVTVSLSAEVSYTLPDAYTYLPSTFSISGAVTLGSARTAKMGGDGIEDNTFFLTLSGDDDRTWNWQCGLEDVCTYEFMDLLSGTYTLTPTLTDYTFEPPAISYDMLTQDMTGQDFLGTRTPDPVVIEAITPPQGPAGGGTEVAVTGSGFDESAAVLFDGSPATGTTFVSTTELSATTPAHAAGTVDVTVTVQTGPTDTLPGAYTYLPPTFSISGTVTLNGGGITDNPFVLILSGDNDLNWNWQCATENVCEYSFPALSSATYTIMPMLVNYTFEPPTRSYDPLTQDMAGQDFLGTPTLRPIIITSVQPDTGPEGGGIEITVTGDFFPGLGTARLTLGGAPTLVTAVNKPDAPGSSLTAIIPRYPVNVHTPVDVVLTDTITGENGSLDNGFTYLAAPLAAPVVDTPPAFINADSILLTGTAESGSFVVVGGGLRPAHHQMADGATKFSVRVMLKQNAVNFLSVAVVNPAGMKSEPVPVRTVETYMMPATLTHVTNLAIDLSLPTTIEFGAYAQFHCFAEFADGSAADVTQFVQWIIDTGGSITASGLYMNDGLGPSSVLAAFGGVASQSILMTDIFGKTPPAEHQFVSGLLKGVVKDTYSEMGLENGAAHIAARRVGDASIETETDTFEYGNYVIMMPANMYDIESTGDGFQTSTVSNYEFLVTIPTPTLNINMTPIDTGPPEVSIIAPETDGTVAGTSAAVTALIHDQYSDIAQAILTVNGGDDIEITSEITEQGYFRGLIHVPKGEVTIRIEALDSAANPQAADEVTFTVEGSGDIDNSGQTNAIDVQLVINSVLGLNVPYDTDINGDGYTNAQDIQKVINAVLGVG